MVSQKISNHLAYSASWLQHLPPGQWSVYKTLMALARDCGLQFAIGGGFATMAYTGQWRDTKDIDFFILARDKDEMIRILTDSSLADYYDQQPYERHWIYRSYKEDIIVDVIWAMANGRAVVDEGWLQGPEVELDGEHFRLVPAEETLWSKLYVLQRDRCDWPDALNLIYSMGTDLNWRRLLQRVDEDAPLLSALLSVFGWLCPERARELPSWVSAELGASRAHTDAHLEPGGNRAPLLDSRSWFTAGSEEHQNGQNHKS
jgi:hypothetical protein